MRSWAGTSRREEEFVFGSCVELDGGLWEGELFWGALEGDFEEDAFLGVWLLRFFVFVFVVG